MPSHTKKDADVIVIGGGPSGSQTAHFASQRGLRVILLEKNGSIGEDVVCSGVISAEAFERYDLPTEAIVGSLREAELTSPGGHHLPYTHSNTAAFVVDRQVFDSMLAGKAAALGTEIRTSSRVTGVEVSRDGVGVTLDGGAHLRAEMVVIATGVSFRLQQMLGLGRPQKILKGMQCELEAVDIPKLRVYFGNRLSRGFFGWAIPLNNGGAKVGIMTDGEPLAGLDHILRDIGAGGSAGRDHEIKKRGISFGTITQSYTDRVLVVGEAAGQIKTTTGGGIYYGLIGGDMASRVIAEAFEAGDFSAGFLKAYESRWKKELGREISFGKYFHWFFSRLDDSSIDRLFQAASLDGLLQHVSSAGSFDWHMTTVKYILASPNLRGVLMRELVHGLVQPA